MENIYGLISHKIRDQYTSITYKNFFSVHLLAVSDTNYKFMMVIIGAYGRERATAEF